MKLPWILCLAVVALFGGGLPARAQSVPPLVNYQGRLTDELGQPLPSGTYSVQFRLWPSVAGTTDLVWARQYDVAVVDGVFHVILGAPGGTEFAGASAAANSLNLAFTEPERYLGITIVKGANGIPIPSPKELTPRQQILSAPFALRADSAREANGVVPGGISSAALATNSVLGVHLSGGAVDLTKLARRDVGTNVGVGGLAISAPVGGFETTSSAYVAVPNLEVTLVTTGRPVQLFLAPRPRVADEQLKSIVGVSADAGFPYGWMSFSVDGAIQAEIALQLLGLGSAVVNLPPSLASCLVPVLPAGKHVFKFHMRVEANFRATVNVHDLVLVAMEL